MGEHVRHAGGTASQPLSAGLPARRTSLLKHATIYTVDAKNTVIADGAILIEDGAITAVGKSSEVHAPQGACVIDAGGHMIVPGFINPHWHEVGAFRLGQTSGCALDDSDVAPSLFSRGADYIQMTNYFQYFVDWNFLIAPEEAYGLSFYSLMNQLRTGTTFVGDMGSFNHWDGMARAMLDLGMRGGPSIWSMDVRLDAAAGKAMSTRPVDRLLEAHEEMLERWAREPLGLVRAQPSVLVPASASDALLRGLGELAAEYDVPFLTHAAAARNERATDLKFFGRTGLQRLEQAGALNRRLVLAHAAFITDEERELLVERGVHLTHSPAKYGTAGEPVVSETKQLTRFAKCGGSLSLSTDAADCGHMIQALRFAYMMHNEANADETTVTPTAALAMATMAGARAVGREREIGSLEVGKRADLVVIRCDDWRYLGVRKPLSQFMSNGGHADVARVFVDGRELVVDGEVVGVDEASARRAFVHAARSVQERLQAGSGR